MEKATTKLIKRGKFDDALPAEEAISEQVASTLQSLTDEFKRQERYGECRSIRSCSIINFRGGKFVVDMRLLPEPEVERDELYNSVREVLKVFRLLRLLRRAFIPAI